jgi:hypothetical protein
MMDPGSFFAELKAAEPTARKSVSDRRFAVATGQKSEISEFSYRKAAGNKKVPDLVGFDVGFR